MKDYRRMIDRLAVSGHAVALTGAGISVESGIPDFRSAGGLWSKYDPMEYAHIQSFRSNPARVWQMLWEMDQLHGGAEPNPAHMALAELERRGIIKEVITQNVDSLHQRAGSRTVIEFHGHNRALRCEECSRRFMREAVRFDTLPPACSCGGPLRPEIVFFGELIPSDALEHAMEAARVCDFLMIVGTSASVAPASQIPRIAKSRGAFLLEVNPGASELPAGMVDFRIPLPAGVALPAIVTALLGD
ncbi:MAG: NAD-dependent deacylase [Syntrophobacteraceae bacterium]|nr:NAD-dependent deacylase [Syntrophobacteraceae bacterium]